MYVIEKVQSYHFNIAVYVMQHIILKPVKGYLKLNIKTIYRLRGTANYFNEQ